MAGWEEELAALLHELGVTQEEPRTHLQPARKRVHSDARWRYRNVDELSWDDTPLDNSVDDDTWLNDPRLMRREVESIVSQVIHLMQRGDLDKSSKEDIMVVWHALRRLTATTLQATDSDEAYLESATAMLHFCRLVLRLSEAAIDDL